jgi:hypothetical protein
MLQSWILCLSIKVGQLTVRFDPWSAMTPNLNLWFFSQLVVESLVDFQCKVA